MPAAVAMTPMIICSVMHARRSDFAVYPAAWRRPMFWMLSSMKFLIEKCMMMTDITMRSNVKTMMSELAIVAIAVVATSIVSTVTVKGVISFGRALWIATS